MPEFSAMENLYRKGILEYNPKDYINGTNSNIIPETDNDIFLPDNRFERVDGSYIRRELDRDRFELVNNPQETINNDTQNNKKKKFSDTLKNILTSKITAGIAGTTALVLAGRYILKLLHIIK